jgi:hypothetical protein
MSRVYFVSETAQVELNSLTSVSPWRAVLRSSLREYIASEAMHHLGVPTTRCLSLTLTGAGVLRGRAYQILLAASHMIPFDSPISVYHFPCGALTLCPQLCMGIQPDARFPARSADACPQLCMGISPRRYTEIGICKRRGFPVRLMRCRQARPCSETRTPPLPRGWKPVGPGRCCPPRHRHAF